MTGGGGQANPVGAAPLLRPFAGLRPAPEFAAEVAAPPYDVPSAAEARELARGRRWSFLHVSRPEIDLPPGADPRSPEAYAGAAGTLRRMVADGVLRRDSAPCYYVYRLSDGGHVQTGIAAAASIQAYESGRIRRHELTRPDKETDRVRHIEALGAQTGPVMAAHRPLAEVAGVVAEVTARPPELEAETADGVLHALWAVAEPAAIGRLGAAFDAAGVLYIADGHHRSAAAARVAAARRAAEPGRSGAAACESFLIVAFPADQLRILGYHRLVRDLGGMTAAGFREAVERDFTLETEAPPLPERRGEFAMYLEGRWHRLVPHRPAEKLDAAVLGERILEPLLGIGDPRRDPRIDFVGGADAPGKLARRVDSGDMAVAFTLHPAAIDEVMAVADAGAILPPKTTWFDPKLADGLISLVLD